MSKPSFPALDVPALLRAHGLQPKKSLGQNFLTDPTLLEQIVDAGQVTPTDTVLEIGPGLGSLTRHLAARAARVIAVELDQNLIPILREVLTPYPNVQILHGDILQLDPKTLLTNSPNHPITDHRSPITDHRSPITDHQSPIPPPPLPRHRQHPLLHHLRRHPPPARKRIPTHPHCSHHPA